MGESVSELQAIYEQDCEFFRYEDTLRWSRFKTAAVIEGALLYRVYQFDFSFHEFDKKVLVTAAVALVALVLMIALRDANIARAHLVRMKKFEEYEPFHRPGGIEGLQLMKAAAAIIFAVNVWLLFSVWLS